MKFNEILLDAAMSLGTFLSAVTPADAKVHALSISGNGWVALLMLLGFVAIIYVVIIGTLKVEERDAKLGRRSDETKGWFGWHQDGGDDDGHHSGDGHSG